MTDFERFDAVLAYEPETGVLRRKADGKIVGTPVKNRNTAYVQFSFDGKTVRAHRIAWLLSIGSWPTGIIDHRNVDNSKNQRNARRCRRNTSGVNGVHLEQRTQKWVAMIWVCGKRKLIGRFAEIENARREQDRIAGYSENHGAAREHAADSEAAAVLVDSTMAEDQ